MKLKLKCYINILKKEFMNNVKEMLHQLKNVFTPIDETPELKEVVLNTEVVAEEVEVTEPQNEEVELAEAPMDAPAEAPVVEEAKVEYATKLELQELQRSIMELLEKVLKPEESKQDVPQELSVEEKPEEISHSPELQVEKKVNLYPTSGKRDTIQSRIYKQLYS